jgi:hypothetical protein
MGFGQNDRPYGEVKLAPARNEDEKNGKSGFDRRLQIAEMFTKVLTTLMLVVGGFVGLAQYMNQQRQFEENRQDQAMREEKDRQAQLARDKENLHEQVKLKQKELQLKFYDQQMWHYLEICDAAAKLATRPRLADAGAEIRTFDELYWGKVTLFESAKVEHAQRAFHDAVIQASQYLDAPTRPELALLAYKLGHACREDLKTGPGL